MTEEPKPTGPWAGPFGAAYTERNRDETVEDVNDEYKERFGITQTALLKRLFDGVDRNARIVEIGCGVGVQLEILHELGFEHLYGLDLQRYPLVVADQIRPYVHPVQGVARHLPFPDNSFDIVCTIDVLIHIPPDTIEAVLNDIVRCSRQLIVGSEYFASTRTEFLYRGQRGIAWKDDFAALYEARRDVETVDTEIIEYVGQEPNTDGDRFRSLFRLETDE